MNKLIKFLKRILPQKMKNKLKKLYKKLHKTKEPKTLAGKINVLLKKDVANPETTKMVNEIVAILSKPELEEADRKVLVEKFEKLINKKPDSKGYAGLLNRIFIKNFIPLVYDKSKSKMTNEMVFMQPRNGLNQSFRYIYDRIKEEGKYEPVLIELFRGEVSKLEYFVNALFMVKRAANAKVVFVHESNNLFGYTNFRPETKVVQLWHGCGVVKKLGLSTADKPGFQSSLTKEEFPEYNKYSIVTMTCEEQIWVFEEFMGIDRKSGIIQPIGMSRTDEFYEPDFLKNSYNKLYKLIPEAIGKKVILYAPTYRGVDPHRVTPDALDIEKFAKALSDEYILIMKHHQTVKELPEIPEEYRDKFAFDMTRGRGMSINELMAVADVCISDYSSVYFEYSLFERPMLFFTYDIDEYIDERGLYYDFSEVTPGPMCSTNEEMIDYLSNLEEKYDPQVVLDFKKKFMSGCDGHATDRILQYIEGGLDNIGEICFREDENPAIIGERIKQEVLNELRA